MEPIDPYHFLGEILEDLGPPENEDDPEEWYAQLGTIIETLKEYEHPAATKLEQFENQEAPLFDDSVEMEEGFRQMGYLIGLNASIGQTYYWTASIVLEKIDGLLDAASTEETAQIKESKKEFEREKFESAYLMWKDGLLHLMYMNHDSFFMPQTEYKFLDYHDKLYVNFAILTASTLVESTLEQILLDMGEDATEKDFATQIDMTAARTAMDDSAKQRLHSLRKVRNMIAHNFLQRTEYRASSELPEFDSHFDATFGVVVESLNIVSDVLKAEYDYDEPFEWFHETTEDMIKWVRDER